MTRCVELEDDAMTRRVELEGDVSRSVETGEVGPGSTRSKVSKPK